jgi:ATP-binding cassette subfamily F protein 3
VKFYAIEEVNYEAEVEKILIGLGFVREDFCKTDFRVFRRVENAIELAKILLQNRI